MSNFSAYIEVPIGHPVALKPQDVKLTSSNGNPVALRNVRTKK